MTTSQPLQRLFSRPAALAVVTACVSTLAAAQQPAPPQPDPAALQRQAEINKRPDTPGTGRFAAMKEEDASLPRHVVYRPKDLGTLGTTKLGVVAWDPEWFRRAAARTSSRRAAGAAATAAHAGVGPDRRR
jgi:hypothetical protein